MNQGNKTMVLLAAAAFLLASVAMEAAGRTPTREQVRKSWQKRFQDLDQNHDGKVSLVEYLAFFRAQSPSRRQYFEYEFRKFDRNGDGFITFEEHLAPVTLRDEFRALDGNQDGRISQEEFLQGERLFRRLDRNHDGCITLEEYLDAYRSRSPGK